MAQFEPEVFITNRHKRYTGVSGTINALLEVQARSLNIGFVGTHMPGVDSAKQTHPERFASFTLKDAIIASRKALPDGRKRIWHVRRDPEMILTIFLRDVLRLPIKMVFTSAAKHRHSWFPRWLISKMDAVIGTTPEASALVPNTKKTNFHGANLKRFAPPSAPDTKLSVWQRTKLPGKYGVGVFGRIRPSKGTDVYVDALIKILPQHPDFSAIICGRAAPEHQTYKDEMLAKIAAANLTERIVFLGEVPIDDVPLWYQNCLIMVASPRYEPFGITPLEAMASGCAVVASNTGAFAYIVEEGATGYIVPTDDSAALAEKLSLLMQSPETAQEFGMRGRERVSKLFSIEQEAAGIEEVYRGVWAEL